jgi:hypothetical protein
MLASHPEFGWFSNFAERFPNWPQIALASRLLEPWCHGGRRKGSARLLPTPNEAVAIPRAVTDGWFSLPRLLAAGEIPDHVVRKYRHYAESTLSWQGKKRLLHKHTGFARVGFLSAVDPTGSFLHIVRDGRAVVDSLLRVTWWKGTMDSWWWGDMPPAYEEAYRRSDKDPAVLGAIVWLHLTDLIEEELASVATDRKKTLRYDSFIQAPEQTLRDICRFADLEDHPDFARRLDRFRIRNGDDGWQQRLSKEQVRAVNGLLGNRLSEYGFQV